MRHLLKTVSCASLALILQGCSSLEEKPPATQRQLQCLAEAIHGEARGEPEEGQIFVGRVIITRVKSGYGKNYCDVVYSKRQFAPKKNPSRASYKSAKKSVQLGPNGITHFHSYSQMQTPRAGFSNAKNCEYKTKVGGHWGFQCYEYGSRKTASSDD